MALKYPHHGGKTPREDYLVLARGAETSEDMYKVLNRRGAPNLTVCPECRVDDFVHVEGCSIAKELDGK